LSLPFVIFVMSFEFFKENKLLKNESRTLNIEDTTGIIENNALGR